MQWGAAGGCSLLLAIGARGLSVRNVEDLGQDVGERRLDVGVVECGGFHERETVLSR